jgi:DNA topoisomerase-1
VIDSADVNEYLREVIGQDFTAKDFRTWAGTTAAAQALKGMGDFASDTAAKKNVAKAITDAAEQLGNTPTICRKCYVHPAVIEAYLNGTLLHTDPSRKENALAERPEGLHPEEAEVLALLRRLDREKHKQAKAG